MIHLKKLVLALGLLAPLVLLSSIAGHTADHPWKNYLGCYATSQLNGAVIPPQAAGTIQGKAEEGDGWFGAIADFDTHKPVPAVNFLMYRGLDEDQKPKYDGGSAFLDRGEFTEDAQGSHYRFSGRLAYNPQPRYHFTLTEEIDISTPSAGVVKVRVMRKVVEFPDYNADDTYILKKNRLYSSCKNLILDRQNLGRQRISIGSIPVPMQSQSFD